MLSYRHFAFAVLVSGALLASSAWAATPCSNLSEGDLNTYNDWIGKAVDAKAAGKFQEGIDALLEARKLCSEEPKFPLRIAQWSFDLGNCPQAMTWYDKVLKTPVKGSFASQIQAAIDEAEVDLIKVRPVCELGSLTVACSDPDVKVSVDAATQDCSPGAPAVFAIKPGTYDVLATRNSAKHTESSVKVGADTQISIPKLSGTLQLGCGPGDEPVRIKFPDDRYKELSCPINETLPPGDYVVTTRTKVVPITLTAGQTYASDIGEKRSYGMTIAGASLIAVGLAGASLGAFFHSESLEAAERANELAKDDGTLDPDDRKTQYDAATKESEDNFLIAVISYSAGGVLVATGITLLVLDLTDSSTESDASSSGIFMPVVLPDGGGITWTTRF